RRRSDPRSSWSGRGGDSSSRGPVRSAQPWSYPSHFVGHRAAKSQRTTTKSRDEIPGKTRGATLRIRPRGVNGGSRTEDLVPCGGRGRPTSFVEARALNY